MRFTMRFAGQLEGDGMNLDDGGYSNNTTQWVVVV